MGRARWQLAVTAVWLGLSSTAAGAEELRDALAATYLSNPTLLAARAELRAVNEGVPQELSNSRPFVSIDGEAGAQHIDSNVRSADTTLPFEASIGVTQPLYRGGRTVAGVARAEAEVMAQRARLQSVEQRVLLGAVAAYMDVWRNEAVLQLNINNEQVLARQLEATEDRFEVGELTRTDVAQSEARLARSTAERIQAEGDLTSSEAVFEEVVGQPPGLLTPPPPLAGLPQDEAEAIAEALDDNPDVLSALFSEEAARKQVRVETGSLLPDVSLTAELRHSENQFSDETEIDEARLLAVFSIPLYQQGLVSSRVREAKQTASRRRVEIEVTRRRIRQDATDTWQALLTAEASRRAFESEVRSSEIALEGVRQENSVGTRTVLDVLDAEQELLDAQVNLTRARRDEVVARYGLLLTLGRLTAANLRLPVEVYDPEADYRAVRDSWFGLDVPGE